MEVEVKIDVDETSDKDNVLFKISSDGKEYRFSVPRDMIDSDDDDKITEYVNKQLQKDMDITKEDTGKEL